MRRKSAFAACTVLALVTPSLSASERQVFPEAVGSQQLFYNSGVAWITNPGSVEVDGSFTIADRSSVWLGLLVRNQSDAPVTIREEDIAANYGSVQLKVWTASELVAEQHRKGNWRKFAAGLAAGLNAYSAGQSGRYSASGTFNGNVQTFGSGGYQQSNFAGNFTASGTDPAAQQRAIEVAASQNQALLAQVQQQGELEEQAINVFAFHSQTIAPGGLISGHVRIDLPRRSSSAEPLLVTIRTGNMTFPLFVGVDGPYNDAQRAKAAEIYAFLQPPPTAIGPTVPLPTANTGDTTGSPDVEQYATRETMPPSTQQTTKDSQHRPRIGDSDYFPTRTIKDRTTSSHPSTLAAIAPSAPTLGEGMSEGRSAFLVSVIGKRLEPCPSDVASTCVAFDVSWQQQAPSQFVSARSGRLLLESSEDGAQSVGIEWSVPDGLAPGKTIEQHGIEFPLGKAGAAKQWLSTTDSASIQARFVSSNSD